LPPPDPAKDRVLDAFERAIVEHGVQAASFARIAREGGFHRSLVQHHFGTRERLEDAALARVVMVYAARGSALLHGHPPSAHLGLLLTWFFAPFGPSGPPRQARVVDAFIALAPTRPAAAAHLRALYGHFTARLLEAIAEHCPEAHVDTRAEAAFAVVCLSFGRAGLDTLGAPDARSGAAKRAAGALLAPLLGASWLSDSAGPSAPP
jgi:AcrR family transcriptional regulator